MALSEPYIRPADPEVPEIKKAPEKLDPSKVRDPVFLPVFLKRVPDNFYSDLFKHTTPQDTLSG
jgi:hypothetical protein